MTVEQFLHRFLDSDGSLLQSLSYSHKNFYREPYIYLSPRSTSSVIFFYFILLYQIVFSTFFQILVSFDFTVFILFCLH